MFGWLRRLFGRRSATPNNREPTLQTIDAGAGQVIAPDREAPPPSSTAFASRQELPPPARPAWLARMPATVLFVDVETTGLTEADRIVSFAGILLTTAELTEGRINLKFGHYIVNPGCSCHPQAAAVHGYSDWMLRHQRPFVHIAHEVVEMLDEAELIVAHNAKFDVAFINAELAALGHPLIAKPAFCTAERYRALDLGGSARLDDVAARIGLTRAGPRHGALEDAWLAMMVYFWLHECPYRMPFSAFPNPHPSNLQPAPPVPDQPDRFEQAAGALRQIFARTDTAPPRISPTFAPAGLERADDGDLTTIFAGRVDDDLRGITFAIEYTDAGGRESTRRITLQDLYRGSDGTPFLRCFCHERQAQRTFRFDRIRSIIDLDGIVHEPPNFFRDELLAPLSPSMPPSPLAAPGAPRSASAPSLPDKPGMAQRRAARDGLRLLAALARSDGIMDMAEIDVIVDFIGERAAREGIATNHEDRLALAAYLKRQRPNADVFDECLARMAGAPVEDQQLLLRSAIALAEADGRRDTVEVAMLAKFANSISG